MPIAINNGKALTAVSPDEAITPGSKRTGQVLEKAHTEIKGLCTALIKIISL